MVHLHHHHFHMLCLALWYHIIPLILSNMVSLYSLFVLKHSIFSSIHINSSWFLTCNKQLASSSITVASGLLTNGKTTVSTVNLNCSYTYVLPTVCHNLYAWSNVTLALTFVAVEDKVKMFSFILCKIWLINLPL